MERDPWRIDAHVPCASVHTSGGRELQRVRVASRRVGLVDVLWNDWFLDSFSDPPKRDTPP